jgi:peroxiredoxin Q/BCP
VAVGWQSSKGVIMSVLWKRGLIVAALSLGAWAVGLRLVADEPPAVELKVGDRAPAFQGTDDQGQPWKSDEHLGKKVVVVYFYPADLTGGCTKQACGFRDDLKKLTDKGVEVIGVSGDSVKNHQLFKQVHKLTFTLLADEDGVVAKKFGVPLKPGGVAKVKDSDGKDLELTRGVTASRWTFVIGKDGKVVFKNIKVDAAEDSKQILEVIEKLDK